MLSPSAHHASKHACHASFRNFCWGNPLTPSRLVLKTKKILDQVRVLTMNGLVQEALSFFYTSKIPPQPYLSNQIYAILFHACARHDYLEEGRALHLYLVANNPTIATDCFVSNHLINMYCKCGQLEYAHHLFDQMPHRNIVSWTTLVSGYAQYGQVKESFYLFSNLLLHYRPNEFAFTSVLSACQKHDFGFGRQVHALALKMSLDVNLFVANALITMYSKCSGCFGGYHQSKDEAWTIFKSMEFRNLISWNSLLSGFQFRRLGAQAVDLFTKMHRNGCGFDRATFLSVFSSLCDTYSDDKIDACLSCCLQLHSLTIKIGIILEVEVTTGLIKLYSDLRGDLSDCYRLFLEIGCRQDVVSWTAVITSFAERNPWKALDLFCQCRENFRPDWYTFSIALKACAAFVTASHALAIHSEIIKSGFQGDTVLGNALIHAYTRCGSIHLSKQVFDEMECRDLVSWNSMLKSYALHGQAKDALQLFQDMNVHPDSATFVALLSACSHAGLVEEGINIFDSMLQDHRIVPHLDHYACMVVIFGRVGRIFEAKEFISKMPIKPDSVIWSALLASCRKHGETNVAKLAAAKLKELEPGNSLGYVQMSNMCCSGKSFIEAGIIREEMRGSKVRKEPGLSWVEIGNRVHEFASGGQRHPQKEAIYIRLEILVGQLKEMGYVPEITLSLYDTEEEQREEQLLHHSEKMALVFAIMNEESLHSGENVIQIMKNVRICVDCHNFMKLSSDLVQKEIIVRDPNRFHHFKYGICSCNDFW